MTPGQTYLFDNKRVVYIGQVEDRYYYHRENNFSDTDYAYNPDSFTPIVTLQDLSPGMKFKIGIYKETYMVVNKGSMCVDVDPAYRLVMSCSESKLTTISKTRAVIKVD